MATEIIEQIDLKEFGDYRVKLENFEGPLDLLLHLIKDAKLDIMTLHLSEITEQYLSYMKDIDSIDMDKASEFIDVAATLLEIKSKKMLPRLEEELSEEEDSESKLIKRLQEYKIFKEASEKLQKREDVNKLFKAPEPSASRYKIILKDMKLDGLLDAFTSLLHKAKTTAKEFEEKKIQKDRYTVQEKMAAVKDAILVKGKLEFEELIEEDATKSEIINVFLALLELLKLQVITVKQDEIFGKIQVVKFEVEGE